MKTDSIAIGLRIGQMVDPALFVAWTRLLRGGLRPSDAVLMPSVGVPHSCACNVLAERFLESQCDALLLLDDDMDFEPDALNALRATDSEHSILSALYTTRREPIRPIVMHRRENGYGPRKPEECHGLVDCDVVGFGFTLISRQVVAHAAEDRGMSGPFQWSNVMGEDGDFCLWAAAHGYKVGCNCDVIVGHRVTYTSTWDAESNAVEMELRNYGMNKKGKG
jgi:cellulose synthase/poly-beta-1,6-N-acetylglucosamine synthase-like glycosyltransferase